MLWHTEGENSVVNKIEFEEFIRDAHQIKKGAETLFFFLAKIKTGRAHATDQEIQRVLNKTKPLIFNPEA